MIRWRLEEIFASERQIFYTNKTIPRHIDYLADVFLISESQRLGFFETFWIGKKTWKKDYPLRVVQEQRIYVILKNNNF